MILFKLSFQVFRGVMEGIKTTPLYHKGLKRLQGEKSLGRNPHDD
jgi:hypothetical protein